MQPLNILGTLADLDRSSCCLLQRSEPSTRLRLALRLSMGSRPTMDSMASNTAGWAVFFPSAYMTPFLLMPEHCANQGQQTVLGLIPVSYLIQRMPVGKFLATASLLWSILTIIYAPCRSWSGFMALRFWMGFLEAAITPTITYIIVAFYKKEEQAPRNASKLSSHHMFHKPILTRHASRLCVHLVHIQRLLRLRRRQDPRLCSLVQVAVSVHHHRLHQHRLQLVPLLHPPRRPHERPLPHS